MENNEIFEKVLKNQKEINRKNQELSNSNSELENIMEPFDDRTKAILFLLSKK